jgi:ADP-heptose:LPS heptosyltransferase
MSDNSKKSEIKKILISRTDRLGDVILTLPLISETKRIFSESKISFLLSNYLQGLLEGYEDIDELIYIEDLKNFKTGLESIRKRKFDIVINVYPRFPLALLFYLSGIKLRVGSAYRWYSFLYNRKVLEHRKYSVKHESDYNLNMLKVFTNDIKYEKKFKFNYTGTERNVAEDKYNSAGLSLNEDYIIIHPGTRGSGKDWSIEKFSDYSNSILESFREIKIVYTGSQSETDLIDYIIKKIPVSYRSNIINLAGRTDLRELMIIIDNSFLFVSNATGPLHLAGALNKKIISLYPTEIPINDTRWKPLSDNPVIIKPKIQGDSMDTIKTEEVMLETRKILDLKN